jgi:hypothetical protein
MKIPYLANSKKYFAIVLGLTFFPLLPLTAAPEGERNIRVIVNSNEDGEIRPDDKLTLREAILLVNGTISQELLSQEEKAQVSQADGRSFIEFNLPSQQTAIALQTELPPLTSVGLAIDGTTQPGYNNALKARSIPAPIVVITPAKDKEILRGLTIVADRITIRGLSVYGFASLHRSTASTPPADIFISNTALPPDADEAANNSNVPPKGVVIESNWIGIPPSGNPPSSSSTFGVSVFNGSETTIRRNWLAYHDGSAIITAKKAEKLNISENLLEHNGFAGMPDAILLEGLVSGTQITNNQIRDNAGSAIYLFKPDGAVKIRANKIIGNGKRYERAAIYLMGNGHEVSQNQIQEQSSAGLVVAAYPTSRGNRIEDNQFSRLQGLSIDLVTQQSTSPQDYQIGDGINPPQDSYQRRRTTANFAVEAPRWLSSEFYQSLQDGTVELAGIAEPNARVEIYRVSEDGETHGPLNQAIASVNTDEEGRFSLVLADLKTGEKISAIATHPEYGTSEPALNVFIRAILW